MLDDSLGKHEREHPTLPKTEVIQSELDTPCSELRDPCYHPSDTPRYRQAFQSTRT